MKFYFRGYNCVFLNSIFFLFFFPSPSLSFFPFQFIRYPIGEERLKQTLNPLFIYFHSTSPFFWIRASSFFRILRFVFLYFDGYTPLRRYSENQIFRYSLVTHYIEFAIKRRRKKKSQFFLKDHNTSVNFLLYRSSIFDLIIKFQMVFHIKKKKKNSFLVGNK